MAEDARTILSYLKDKNSKYGPYTWQSVNGEVTVQWLPDEKPAKGWIDIKNPKGVKGASGFRKLMKSTLPKLDIISEIPAQWEWNPDDVKKGGIYEYLGPKMKGSFTPNPDMPNKAAVWDTRPKSKGTIMSVKKNKVTQTGGKSTGEGRLGQGNEGTQQKLNNLIEESKRKEILDAKGYPTEESIELGTKTDTKAEINNLRREVATQLEAARDLNGVANIEGNKNILSKLRDKLKNLPKEIQVSNVNKLFRALRKGIKISDIPLSDLPSIKSENSKEVNKLTDKEVRKLKATGVIDGEFTYGPILRWGKRMKKWGVDLEGNARSIEGFVKWLNKSYSDAQIRAKLEGTRPWRGEYQAGHGTSVQQGGSHSPGNLAPQPARKIIRDLIGNLDIKGKSLHTLEDLQRAGVDGGTLLGAFQEYMNEGEKNILRFADLPMRDRSLILHGVDIDGNALNSEALSIAARRKLDDRAGELFIKRANPDLPKGRNRMEKILDPAANTEILEVKRSILGGKGFQNVFTTNAFKTAKNILKGGAAITGKTLLNVGKIGAEELVVNPNVATNVAQLQNRLEAGENAGTVLKEEGSDIAKDLYEEAKGTAGILAAFKLASAYAPQATAAGGTALGLVGWPLAAAGAWKSVDAYRKERGLRTLTDITREDVAPVWNAAKDGEGQTSIPGDNNIGSSLQENKVSGGGLVKYRTQESTEWTTDLDEDEEPKPEYKYAPSLQLGGV